MKLRLSIKTLGLIAGLLGMLAMPLIGQTSMAAINGTVTDASGAVIPGAKVTATNQQQNTNFTTTANAKGIYNLPRVPTGTYTIQATANGFQTSKQGPFQLILDQTAQINLKLKVGQESQTVQVTGQAPLLQTETTTTATNLNSIATNSLPLVSRNYVQLTMLSPGAVTTSPGSGSSAPFINGNRQQANNYLLGGVDNNQTTENQQGYTPVPDAIEEFNLITSNASAEYGNFQGGVISVAIKSGTNNWHGDLWEYLQNDKLNANSWSNNYNHAQRSKVRSNEFGGAAGGPIIHNRLFVFGDYDGSRYDVPTSTGTTTVFTQEERAGNFGAACLQAGGAGPQANGFNSSGVCVNSSGSPLPAGQLYAPGQGVAPQSRALVPFNILGPSGANLPENIVAQNLFSSANQKLYPLPNFTGGNIPDDTGVDTENNYQYTTRSYTNQNQGDLRVDYNLNSANRVYWRGSMMRQTNPSVSTFPLDLPTTNTAHDWNSVLDWTHSIGATFVNDAKLGINYVGGGGTVGDNGFGNIAQNLGIVNGNDRGPGLMGIVLDSSPNHIGGNADTIGLRGASVITAEDQMIITWGRHLIHTGFQYMRYRSNYFYGGNTGLYGSMHFSGVFTDTQIPNSAGNLVATGGYDAADFWLGLVDNGGRGPGTGVFGQRKNVVGDYIQDDWRVSNHLTLNLGLRYEYTGPLYEKYNRELNITPFSGELMYAGTQAAKAFYDDGRALYRPSNRWSNLQPRLGFAWSANDNTVVSGAYSIATYMEGTGLNLRPTTNPPYGAEYQENNGDLNYPTFTTDQAITSLTQSSDQFAHLTARLWEPDLQPAVTEQWSLNIQRQLSNSTTFRIGYLGQHSTHLVTPVQLLDKVMPVDCRNTNQGGYILGAPCNTLNAQPDPNNPTQTLAGTGPSPSPYLWGTNGLNPNNIVGTTLVNGQPTGGQCPNGATASGPCESWNLANRLNNISGTLTDGVHLYHSLQAVLQRRFSSGLQFQGSYTWSKCMSDSGGFYGAGGSQSSSGGEVYAEDTFNQRLDYGPCFNDVTHLFSAYAVYQLPFGANRAFNLGAVGNQILGGWQLSGTWNWHTGFAFAPTGLRKVGNGDQNGANRAACNGPAIYTHTLNNKNGFLYIDNSNGAFTNSPAGEYASCGRGVLRGPGLDTMNLSVARNVNLTEAKYVQIRADFNNLTNTPEFSVPNSNANSTSFGQITGAQGARTITLALKLYF